MTLRAAISLPPFNHIIILIRVAHLMMKATEIKGLDEDHLHVHPLDGK